MAVFVDHPCKVDLDTIVDKVCWSSIDPIAALASSRLDDKDRENFQVLFVNNEVNSARDWKVLIERIILLCYVNREG